MEQSYHAALASSAPTSPAVMYTHTCLYGGRRIVPMSGLLGLGLRDWRHWKSCWILIAIGGALRALARHAVDRVAISQSVSPLVGTFVVNMSGSFVLTC